ncbi:hypothetical protein AAFF_G00207320 [Aldrovandia affinis]|uniref:Uncharacterized protein n=1 Tax=Aldrovandia affinis TaxID=143900 RepID=A0AAD7RHB2_9TELE|nr:hypothetical protein AAFF_G00207320 [Aldrovandia affinis]
MQSASSHVRLARSEEGCGSRVDKTFSKARSIWKQDEGEPHISSTLEPGLFQPPLPYAPHYLKSVQHVMESLISSVLEVKGQALGLVLMHFGVPHISSVQ